MFASDLQQSQGSSRGLTPSFLPTHRGHGRHVQKTSKDRLADIQGMDFLGTGSCNLLWGDRAFRPTHCVKGKMPLPPASAGSQSLGLGMDDWPRKASIHLNIWGAMALYSV